MKKNTIFAGFAALCLASPAWAAGVLYECDITDHERARGWISPKIAIVVPGDKTVSVVDAITLTFVKKPVSGTILRDNAKRLIIKWGVQGVKSDDGTSFASVNYRASISKTTGAIDVTTIPTGYDIGLRAKGACKKRNK
ncbi:MAG: hypothetical protein ACSHWS_02765 [Sulfitobacter sp.]